MKTKFILLLLILLPAGIFIAQQRQGKSMASWPDSKLWQKVDSLDALSMPLQAQPYLDELKHRARQTKKTAEAVKILIYNMKLNERRTEEALKVYISELEKETQTAWEPFRQITHSMLGEMYQTYYQQNRYRLLDEPANKETAPTVWSHKEVVEKIIQHYRASLQNTKLLQNSKIGDYKTILTPSNLTENLRPTLYDFLAHRAIGALQNSEYDIIRPMQEFVMDDPQLWLPAKEFVSLPLEPSTDSLNPQREAMVAMQQLLKFRLADTKNRSAFFDAERNRLNHLRNSYQGEGGDSLYWQAISQLRAQKPDSNTEASLLIDQAQFLMQPSQTIFTGKGKQHPANEALKLLDNCIKQHPKSPAACEAHNLKQNILQKEVSIMGEQEILPNEVLPFQINYRNLTNLHLTIYRLTAKQFEDFQQNRDSLPEKLASLKPISSTEIKLPDLFDHQSHTLHYEAQPLTAGLYMAAFSTKPTPSTKDNLMNFIPIQVTELSAMTISENKESLKVKVCHRKSGLPIENVAVTLTTGTNRWDQKQETSQKSTTNQQGEATFNIAEKNRSQKITLQNSNDQYIGPDHWSYFREQEDRAQKKSLFFTDRKIYRPGQTIHFKGIRITGQKNDWQVVANQSTTVVLRDANGTEQGKATLQSNGYGSVWGSFTIPQGSLNGSWTIQNEDGSIDFSVEEYKRPRFEVTFAPFKEVVLPGEKASIAGETVAYAGNRISGAKVQYKIYRQQQFFIPRRNPKEQVIAFGETTTDGDGKFEFSFVATPDPKLKKTPLHESYQIKVDITDLNGETREAETTYQVLKSGIIATLDGAGLFLNNDSIVLNYSARNANQQPAQWEGMLKIEQLKRKTEWQPTAYWPKPDTTSRQVHFDFSGNDPWIPGLTIVQQNLTMKGQGSINLSNTQTLAPGHYQAELTGKDRAGAPILLTHRFIVLEGTKSEAPHDATEAMLKILSKEMVPGGQMQLLVASSLSQATAMITCQFDDGTTRHMNLQLDGNQKIVTLEIPKNQVEQGEISMAIIHSNRKFMASESFNINHPQRALIPELTSWRDKTQPGSTESWTLKVTRNGQPSTNTEVTATLYDASLDAYAANEWYFSAFGRWFQANRWDINGFDTNYGMGDDRIPYHYKDCKSMEHHQLNWFGFAMGHHRGIIIRGMGSLKKSTAVDYLSNKVMGIVQEDADVPPLMKMEESIVIADADRQAIRKDFSETAFFYPDLVTNDKGETLIKFALPDNVTTYKFMALAHTNDGAWGKTNQRLMVQKELMVQPNLPLFLREGDEIILTAKIVSLSQTDQHGVCNLAITNATTQEPVEMVLDNADRMFNLPAGGTTVQSWKLKVPANQEAIKISILAKTGSHTDGEEQIIPILPRSVPVYESESFALLEPGRHNLKFPGYETHKGSQKMVFTYSTATAAEVLKALPLLLDYPHQGAEQLFGRYFGYAVGTHLAKEEAIAALLDRWHTEQLNNKKPLQSPLLQNEALKSIALKETPWVAEAAGETQMRQQLLQLRNTAETSNAMTRTINKLAELQLPDGSFPWFAGMQPSRYITQHIVAGFGWLNRMNAQQNENPEVAQIIGKGVSYLEKELTNDYRQWQRDTSTTKVVGSTTLHLLYALSYHKGNLPDSVYKPFIDNIKTSWPKQPVFSQALAAMVLHRIGETTAAQQVVQSIRENLVRNGVHLAYSKSNGYYWYNNSLETQAMLIQAMNEIAPQSQDTKALRNWLITQKRTQSWPTTKGTTMAVYAVMGAPEILKPATDQVKIGQRTQSTSPAEPAITLNWTDQEVTTAVSKARIDKKSETPSFGAWHYFYFENNDQVKAHQSSELAITRELFAISNTSSGDRLVPMENQPLKRGDKLRVRLTITAQNRMEYLHIRDQRAAGVEPAIQLSGYRYSKGLGYYQTMHDASADFFIDQLPKGTWVIEYDLVAVQSGKMSHGFASIESVYAPEMKAHSEGLVLEVTQ
ncbi:MAG: alpha-2-macroglobulin family protein [Breznakibacter sp.]